MNGKRVGKIDTQFSFSLFAVTSLKTNQRMAILIGILCILEENMCKGLLSYFYHTKFITKSNDLHIISQFATALDHGTKLPLRNCYGNANLLKPLYVLKLEDRIISIIIHGVCTMHCCQVKQIAPQGNYQYNKSSNPELYYSSSTWTISTRSPSSLRVL